MSIPVIPAEGAVMSNNEQYEQRQACSQATERSLLRAHETPTCRSTFSSHGVAQRDCRSARVFIATGHDGSGALDIIHNEKEP